MNEEKKYLENIIFEEAINTYKEFPNNPKDKPEWTYNRDVNCFMKRKAFIKGALSDSAKKYWENELKKR